MSHLQSIYLSYTVLSNGTDDRHSICRQDSVEVIPKSRLVVPESHENRWAKDTSGNSNEHIKASSVMTRVQNLNVLRWYYKSNEQLQRRRLFWCPCPLFSFLFCWLIRLLDHVPGVLFVVLLSLFCFLVYIYCTVKLFQWMLLLQQKKKKSSSKED